MLCPKCNKEIREVYVTSECWQKATVKDGKIVDYGTVEEILDTLKIEHADDDCSADLTNIGLKE